MSILSIIDLRNKLSTEYTAEVRNDSKLKRIENIDGFLNINRTGLTYKIKEKRLLLYETLKGEKIYIQFPGMESVRENNPMIKDFRPELQFTNGEFLPLATFGWIWDVLDTISNQHKDYLDLISTLFFKMAYMINYKKTSDELECFILDKGNVEQREKLSLIWNKIDLSNEIFESLNNYIGDIQLNESTNLSFEGFIKFFDLLLQNEDCKYYYKEYVQNGNINYRSKLDKGRVKTIHAHLLIINYLQDSVKLSNLLNAFQKARGVPNFRIADYPLVSKGMIKM